MSLSPAQWETVKDIRSIVAKLDAAAKPEADSWIKPPNSENPPIQEKSTPAYSQRQHPGSGGHARHMAHKLKAKRSGTATATATAQSKPAS